MSMTESSSSSSVSYRATHNIHSLALSPSGLALQFTILRKLYICRRSFVFLFSAIVTHSLDSCVSQFVKRRCFAFASELAIWRTSLRRIVLLSLFVVAHISSVATSDTKQRVGRCDRNVTGPSPMFHIGIDKTCSPFNCFAFKLNWNWSMNRFSVFGFAERDEFIEMHFGLSLEWIGAVVVARQPWRLFNIVNISSEVFLLIISSLSLSLPRCQWTATAEEEEESEIREKNRRRRSRKKWR